MTETETEAGVVDMDAVVDELHRRGVHAYVEHTGDGVATIYAGPQHELKNWGPVWACLAGPGTFSGPGWTNPRGALDDFCVGEDAADGMELDVTSANRNWTAHDVADAVCERIDRYKAAQAQSDEPRG